VKIKVFLYAHVNHIGAFNLSALHLAQHLSKEKFEIYTLSLSNGSLTTPECKGVKIFRCFYPAKVSNYLGIVWGIYNSDVVFVLRGNHFRFVRFCLFLFKKKSFKRQGNKIDDEILGSISSTVGGRQNIADSYNFCTRVFSPTESIGRYNFDRWGIKYDKTTFLPPFINTSGFSLTSRERNLVKNIVFVGNDMIRKNISFFIKLSLSFHEIMFHVVGKEPSTGYFEGAPDNLIYHGPKPPDELNDFLDDMDLHCLTSRSEGFGKVTIELAAKGIPSVLFDDYAAYEWLENGKEGVIAKTDCEYEDMVRKIINDVEYYHKLQRGCKSLAERFSMKNQLKKYENIISELYAS
jgi:glycosyltransferase involved in cell wall biosynthesis